MSETSPSIFDTFLDQFHHQCEDYLHTQLNTHLFKASSKPIDKTKSNFYLNEYQRCLNDENLFIEYIREQMTTLDALKASEVAIDSFLQRLKAIHEYELKQNEVFEQILHELAKRNPSNKEERLQLLGQIDELIVFRSKLTGINDDDEANPTNKLTPKSSDTFKNIL